MSFSPRRTASLIAYQAPSALLAARLRRPIDVVRQREDEQRGAGLEQAHHHLVHVDEDQVDLQQVIESGLE